MKLFAFFLVSLVLLQIYTEAFPVSNDDDSTAMDDANEEVSLGKKYYYPRRKINCSYACARRCKLTSRKKVCHRACHTCCARCHCVPPGTYGNKNGCPCYARLKTHGNKPKCP